MLPAARSGLNANGFHGGDIPSLEGDVGGVCDVENVSRCDAGANSGWRGCRCVCVVQVRMVPTHAPCKQTKRHTFLIATEPANHTRPPTSFFSPHLYLSHRSMQLQQSIFRAQHHGQFQMLSVICAHKGISLSLPRIFPQQCVRLTETRAVCITTSKSRIKSVQSPSKA
jgi:hypothetical protein